MKMIFWFIKVVALTLSFITVTVAVAVADPEQPDTDIEFQQPAVTEPTLHQQSVQETLFATLRGNTPAAADDSSELLTEISVYLIIIAIYSLYWFLCCSKKVSD